MFIKTSGTNRSIWVNHYDKLNIEDLDDLIAILFKDDPFYVNSTADLYNFSVINGLVSRDTFKLMFFAEEF